MWTLSLGVKTWSLIWMDYFLWYFWITSELHKVWNASLTHRTWASAEARQAGAQTALLRLYFLKNIGLLNQISEEWGGHRHKCHFGERTALSLPCWKLFNFCSLLTVQTQNNSCTSPAVLSQIPELPKNIQIYGIQNGLAPVAQRSIWDCSWPKLLNVVLQKTNTTQPQPLERQVFSLRKASMASLDTPGKICSSAGEISKNNKNYLITRNIT